MKECNLICGSFLALQDGDGSRELSEQAARHFDACPDCREEFQWYGLAVHALSRIEPVEPPPDFLRQLNRRLDELRPPSYLDHIREFFSFSARHIPIPVGVCALVACAVLGVLLYQGPPLDPASLVSMVRQEPATSGPEAGVTAPPGPQTTVPAEKRRRPQVSLPVDAPEIRPLAMAPKRRLTGEYGTLSKSLRNPTIADIVGADNVTVESHTAATVAESFKHHVLPRLNGRIVEEQVKNADGEIVLGVAIPSSAYGAMNSELLNHGALVSGAGSGVQPPRRSQTDDYVRVYIRFTRPQQ
ncbi:MAG: hypothetical protein AB1646_15675 [Thermodesulfobacteriota bacterium]